MQAHVFNHAENRNIDLLEHLETLARVHQRNVLRRGHNHRTGDGDALRKRQLNVAGARRQIDHQIIDVAPVGFIEQLLQRLRHHRAAPYHRRFDVDHESDRHCLDAVPDHRFDALAVFRFGFSLDAQHGRLRRPVDIGVEYADRGALGGQRQREIDGRGRFAHTALARGHCNDVLHARHQFDAALHGVRDDLHRHVRRYLADARQRLEFRLDGGADRLDLRFGRIAEQHIERDVVAVDLDVARFFAGDVVLACVRIKQATERFLDLLFGDCHGCPGSLR